MGIRKIELRKRGSTDFNTDDILLYPVTDWAYIVNKPTTFTPSSHGNSAHSTDFVDQSTTNLGKTGNVSLVTLSSAADWANLPVGKMVMVHSGSTGKPSWMTSYIYVIRGPNRDSSGGYSAIAINYSTGEISAGIASTNTVYPTWLRNYNANNNNIGTGATNYLAGNTSIPAAYSLPLASTVRGGVKIGYSSSGLNRAVALSSEKMYVALPKATASQYGVAKISYSSGIMTIDVT